MIPYRSRISVAEEYTSILGHVIYNFAVTQWNVVYLGTLVAPSFISRNDVNNIGSVATDFALIADVGKYPEFKDIAAQFSNVTKRYLNMLHTTGFTAADGEQLLGSSDAGDIQWTIEAVTKLAEDLESLDIDTNALYQKLKT